MEGQRIEVKSALQDKVEIVNMRRMRVGWSKLLNQQDNILVLTKRGKVAGFYIPYEVAKNLPNKYKVFFLYLLDVYAKKAVPELEEIVKEKAERETSDLGVNCEECAASPEFHRLCR